jgi:hypothetical protein
MPKNAPLLIIKLQFSNLYTFVQKEQKNWRSNVVHVQQKMKFTKMEIHVHNAPQKEEREREREREL